MFKTKKVICLHGSPGCGKSTAAAGLFYHLKMKGYDCELIREYVKDWVWEDRKIIPGDQTYFFAKQARKERVLIENNLDFIITDSPLILTHFYGLKYCPMEQQYATSLKMLEDHYAFIKSQGYSVDHYVLERRKEYNPSGRIHTEEQAKQFDLEIRELLLKTNIKYDTINGYELAVEQIMNIMEKI